MKTSLLYRPLGAHCQRTATVLICLVGYWLGAHSPLLAQRIQMDDGRIYQGRVLPVTGVADPPLGQPGKDEEAVSTPILLIDDELRRIYVPKANVRAMLEKNSENLVPIRPWQPPVAKAGNTLASVGPSLGVTPFDQFGRRTYEMQTRDGALAVVQGITELTARYAKVESLLGPKRSVVWDMRIATSSIPRKTLAAILAKAVSHENPQDWLQVVRFYLQGERYSEALAELEQIINAFPAKQDLLSEVKQLRRLGARRILKEIELRQTAGQHQLTGSLLANFPTEDVAGETLQRVREALAAYEAEEVEITRLANLLRSLTARIESQEDRQLVGPIVDEIIERLNRNNLERLASFAQLADDETMTPTSRLALAISGWILGPTEALQELSVASSFVTVRKSVREYLNEPQAHKRQTILDSITTLPGVTVPRVAGLLAHMQPPLETKKEYQRGPGAFELVAPGKTEDGNFRYHVQLPAEYDAARRYPTLIVLRGAFNTAEQELEFWAGRKPQPAEGQSAAPRRGQSMRHGYIVVAIEWLKPRQYEYEYSLREHEAVLATLRDAMRRFSIDADRVFLSGHGIGGDAAWDIGLAHPDMWAGVVPFVARISTEQKFVQHYWENAAYLPLYFVIGELDGSKIKENAVALDKYLKQRFNTTVVEYRGRGYEPFHDEIHALFDWLGRQKRVWPQEFECSTMRSWDNYFWWIEGRGFPNAVIPGNWPRSARPTTVEGSIRQGNSIRARTASDATTLWLRPEVVDFEKPMSIEVNRRRSREVVEPSLKVLLEDTRTRGDRLRPFWAKVEFP